MALLDEIEFKVYRSHIKIPLIFFVPAICLATLYVLLYLYVNSNWFLRSLEDQLHQGLGGQFEVTKLVVSPTLTRVNVYEAYLRTPAGGHIISAQYIDAAINPLLALSQRIEFEHGHVVGANVRLEFDAEGNLNLFKGLGLDRDDSEREDDDEARESGISLGFSNLRLEDSEFRFIDTRFDFHIPHVAIPNASIFIEPNTILMNADRLRVPRADFRFRAEMFGFDADVGDWRFSVEDFEVDDWRWLNDGFFVERVAAKVEGISLEVGGRMAFPSRPPGSDETGGGSMTYQAKGRLSAPYWSTLVYYFTRGNIHYEIPELEVAVEGTLQEIDGAVSLHASVLEVADLFFEDLRAELTLHNRFLTLHNATANFYGGRLELPYAFFNLLGTNYAAEVNFEDVNPAHALADMKLDLPWLDGQANGGLFLVGQVPPAPRYRVEGGPYPMLDYATARYADITLTKPLALERNNRELFPVDAMQLTTGSRAWVTMDHLMIPEATIQTGGDVFEVKDFLFNYQTFKIEMVSGKRPASLRARLRDINRYAPTYGLEGLGGAANVAASAWGFIGSPDGHLAITMIEPTWSWQDGSAPAPAPPPAPQGRGPSDEDDVEAPAEPQPGTKVTRLRTVNGKRLDAAIGLRRGEVTIERFDLDGGDGKLSVRGKVGLLKPPWPLPVARHQREILPLLRPVQPVDLKVEARGLNLAVFGPQIHPQLRAKGRADADLHVLGTLQRPRATFSAALHDGSIRDQVIDTAELRGDFDEKMVRLASMTVDAGLAGFFEGHGHYGFDQSVGFKLEAQRFDLAHVHELAQLPVSVVGSGDFSLSAAGTIQKPELSGGVRLRDLGVGARRLGDVALVAHTMDQALHLAGALLPWVNLAVEIPLNDGPYYARIGMEQLDLMQALPELRSVAVLDDMQVTGMVEFFMERDFSRYQALTYLTELKVDSLGQMIRNRGPIIAGLNNGEILQIQQATIGTSGRFISLQGGLVMDPALIDLKLEGDLDLGLLNSIRAGFPEFFPEIFVESQGFLMVDGNLRGTPGSLIADGRVTFGPSEIQLRTLQEPLQIGSGEINFDRHGVEISAENPLTGNLLGGVVRLAGGVGFVDYQPKTMDLHLWSHNMSHRIPGMANLTFDTNLKLQAGDIARMETWRVSGDVDILDGLYYREINLVERQLTGRVIGAFNRQTERFEASLLDQMPQLGDINFDLAIRARDGFRLRNAVDRLELDLEFLIDLRLRDTLAAPKVSGDIDVIDGNVAFQGERFEVRSGTVRFTGDLDNPWIDILAGADVRNTCREADFVDEASPTMSLSANVDTARQQYYHILLNIRGNLDNLDIHMESNPYADQRDILSMLLTGCTVDQLTASSASRPTLEIALGPLLGRLEREIQDVVKVEEFTIMPGVERTQVRISDNLTRRLSWRFQLDTGFSEATGGQQYQLEYKLSDNWSAELSERSRQETDSFLIDLKLKYRLPLD